MEPVQRILPPRPGFLEGVRELTARHDVPLVFDEIVTGFRLAYGGAQAYYGVVPDVCTLGKVLGGAIRSPPSPGARTSWPTSMPVGWDRTSTCCSSAP